MVALKIGVKKTFGNRCITIKTKKEMKKNLFMVAAVALMALISCNKEEINNNVVEQPQEPSYYVEFVASIADDADTKAFDAATPKTYWVEGEAISINGKKFEVKEVLENGNAIFENKEELGEGFGAPYSAVYPYSAGTSFDAVTVPSEQTAIAGNIAPEALVAVAQSENNTLNFKHLTSLLKFQVPAACSEVTISSGNALSGSVKVTSVLDKDIAFSDESASKSLKITGSFEAGKDYYLSVLPGTKSNFVVRIDGYLSRNAESVNISRSKIVNMKKLPAAVDAKWRLKGSFDWSTGKVFYKDLNGYIVVKNVTFDSTTEFKAHNQDGKDEWCRAAANVALGNQWYKIGQYDGGNSRIIKGTYDVYVDPVGYNIYFITAGENLTAAIPTTRIVTVYLNSTDYNSLWCWNKDKSSENFTGGSWPGQNSTTNEVINGKTYRKWVLKSCNIGAYTNMIFSKNGNSQTGEDGNTGLLMGETMFVKLDGGKTRFNNDI